MKFAFMKKIILVFILMLTSFSCSDKPTYLECSIKSAEEENKFSVYFDEANGKITHSQPGGYAFNAEGFFALDKITYQKIDITSGLKFIKRYEINRTNLSVIKTFSGSSIEFPDKIAPTILKTNGSCKVVTKRNTKI